MNVYIAGTTSNQEFLRVIKQRIVLLGHPVSSTWLETAYQYTDKRCTAAHMKKDAPRDLDEIRECDLFIMDRTRKSWGKDTEMGMALALGKPVWLVGTPKYKNVFFALAERTFPNWCSVFETLEKSSLGSVETAAIPRDAPKKMQVVGPDTKF